MFIFGSKLLKSVPFESLSFLKLLGRCYRFVHFLGKAALSYRIRGIFSRSSFSYSGKKPGLKRLNLFPFLHWTLGPDMAGVGFRIHMFFPARKKTTKCNQTTISQEAKHALGSLKQ